MTPRGSHPHKPRPRLSQKERDIADTATFVLWSSNAEYQAYVDERHRLLALGWEKSEAEGEAVRVVKERNKVKEPDHGM